jgi:PST family polysaccharide transporter
VLLAGPGVLATLALTPLVLTALYSTKFQAAVEPLRWICLGMMLRVITWPLGFILVSRGLRSLFVGIDLACALVHIGLAWGFVAAYGVAGAGMAFFGSYLFHALAIYPLVRNVTGFRYSRANHRLLLLFLSLIGLVFSGFYLLPSAWATAVGALAAVGSGVYTIRVLAHLIPLDRAPPLVRRTLSLLRLVPAGQGH